VRAIFQYTPPGQLEYLSAVEIKSIMNQIFSRGQRHELIPVFQHGRDAADYLLAHILAVHAVVKGDASSKWIAAATLDRYLQAIGHPQVFGTQYLDRDFLLMMEHKNDPQTLRDHNPETGVTQQPYNLNLVPDALRLAFCVPDLAQQKANLKDVEAGQYPKGIFHCLYYDLLPTSR